MIFRYQPNATDSWHLMISYSMCHFTDTINAIMKSWNTWSWWSLEVGTPTLTERPLLEEIIWCNISCKYYHSSTYFFICHSYMICHHDTHNQIWKKIYGFYLDKKFWMSFSLRPGRNYAVSWCNNFMIILFFLYCTMCCSCKGSCDMKSVKIPTADVWFPRYLPWNFTLTMEFALVLVFINFLWAV